jgi:hypothetical protein
VRRELPRVAALDEERVLTQQRDLALALRDLDARDLVPGQAE